MLLRRQTAGAAPRRGVILLVVLAMLTLFSIVGLTFVLFSDSTALSSSINKQAETQIRPDVDPDLAMSLFLGQLIYDTHDDEIGVQSALRGQSFARNMYGANFTQVLNKNGTPSLDANGMPQFTGDNSLPYCGIGRFHTTGANAAFATIAGLDDYNLPNYQYFRTDGIVRDPEHMGPPRTSAQLLAGTANPSSYIAGNPSYTYCDANSMFLAFMDSTTGAIKVPSFHRPWMFGPLDQGVNPNWTNAQGKYMSLRPRPAEHPNFPFPQDLGGDVKNADWAPGGCDSIWIDIGAPVMTMADGRRYKMLVAPLILDLDGRLNLNVAGNLMGGTRNGTLNPRTGAAPNNQTHASNQGWGPWEMNPAKVLNATFSAEAQTEWRNILEGSGYYTPVAAGSVYRTTTTEEGRYGADHLPSGGALPAGTFLHAYAPIDFDGVNDPRQAGAGTPTSPYLLPGAVGNGNKPWYPFPNFPAAGYGNASPVETNIGGVNGGIYVHPAQYNPMRPSSAGGDDRRLSVQSMHAMLRSGGTGGEFLTSDLRILMDNLVLDPTPALSLKRRNQITTLSMDLDRPSVIPFVWDPNDNAVTTTSRFQLKTQAVIKSAAEAATGVVTITTAAAHGFVTGETVAVAGLTAVGYNGVFVVTVPSTTTFTYTAPGFGLTALPAVAAGTASATSVQPTAAAVTIPGLGAPPPATGEFDPATWRALTARLGRVNLNRPLRRYPNLTGTAATAMQTGVINSANAAARNQYLAAVQDRQQLAQDMFNVFLNVVFGGNPATPSATTVATVRMTYGATSPEYMATRWLAQLSVNIVDYIDEDDYMTPFNWDPANTTAGDMGWVFGVELPRLTLNEAYAQLDNDNSDTQIHVNPTPTGPFQYATQPYRMNVWLELHDPLPADAAAANGHEHSNPNAQLQLTMAGAQVPVYQVLLTQTGLRSPGGPLANPANVTGDPTFNGVAVNSTMNNWGANAGTQTVLAANGAYNGPNGSNQGFYVLGAQPPNGQGGGYFNAGDNPNFPVTLASTQMSYAVPLTTAPLAASAMPGVGVVLQRLACPHMPPNPLPGKPGNNPALPPNPYITTDTLELLGTNSPTTSEVWDSRRFLPSPTNPATASHPNTATPVATPARTSFGRLQPYAAAVVPGLVAQMPNPPQANTPQHTFYRQNATAGTAPAIIAASNFTILSPNGAKQVGTTVTVTTTAPHGFVVGQKVFMTDVNAAAASVSAAGSSPPLNGVFTIKAVPSATTFTYTVVAANATVTSNGSGGFVLGETLKTTFDWPTHLDRMLISPMELINVSAVKPHELTYRFQNGSTQSTSNNPSTHLAQWTKGDWRLYRAFEFLTTGSFQGGYAVMGRVPGKINVNTMGPADLEVFRAIVDAQQGNSFFSTSAANTDTTVVDPLFSALIANRTPTGVPSQNDTPYLSLATGHAPGNDLVSTGARSLSNALLRPGAGGGATQRDPQRMLEPTYPTANFVAPTGPYPAGTPQTTIYHPYQRYELLNKIMNNFTVRSNVYAVWMTVGFFEVTDDTTMPVTLGAEIGRSENRHIRHRMFAIVDRTQLQMASTTLRAGNAGAITIPAANAAGAAATPNFVVKNIPTTLTATTGANTASNLQWTVQAGTMLTVDPNTDTEETVTVFQGAAALQARFFKSHAAGATVIVRGNPGPILRYNPRSDSAVVPYLAVID